MREKVYTIPLRPIAWARTGVVFKQRKFFDKQKHEKLSFGLHLVNQHNNEPFFKIPKITITLLFKETKKSKSQPGYPYYAQRPDGDNCQKFLLDVMNGIIYQDDATVVHGEFIKQWAPKDGVIITVRELA